MSQKAPSPTSSRLWRVGAAVVGVAGLLALAACFFVLCRDCWQRCCPPQGQSPAPPPDVV